MPDTARILIIDDSEDDRFLYRRALCTDSRIGYEIIEKDNGEEGLNCIADEEPHCILLDYSLPGRNGIEVLKRIRSKYPFIAVVMLTGQGNEAVAVTAMREGAQHYVTKAMITPETLQQSVRVAIEYCKLQKHIHEQQSSLEMFTRALAHDLKEPVRTIRSFLDLIMRQGLTAEKTQKYFDYILQAAERMGALIDMVYFYMRLESEEISREVCDSWQALEDAKQNLAALIRERKAIITADDLPQVQANRTQFTQIMQNLLCNAIKHCEYVPVINVSATLSDDRWLFRVTDNGPGIPEEYRQKIFEPFKRLVRHKEDGLGLGLAICKKIIEGSGGRIWCEPAPQQGTAFCFTYAQAAPVLHARPATLPEPMSAAALSAATGVLANILMVEDNEADVELNRLALLEEQKLRCHLFVAHNGREGLARLEDKAHAIDLVLLDINMPGMDGFEMLKQMRQSQEFQSTPVVMCSTSTYDRDIEQAKTLGAAGYLVKPLDFGKLKPILETASNLRLCTEDAGYTLKRAANA